MGLDLLERRAQALPAEGTVGFARQAGRARRVLPGPGQLRLRGLQPAFDLGQPVPGRLGSGRGRPQGAVVGWRRLVGDGHSVPCSRRDGHGFDQPEALLLLGQTGRFRLDDGQLGDHAIEGGQLRLEPVEGSLPRHRVRLWPPDPR